jgi:HK97 family phage major capsid protein
MKSTLDRLYTEYRTAAHGMRELTDLVEAEKRDMTGEEQAEWDRLNTAVDGLNQRIGQLLEAEERTRNVDSFEARIASIVATPAASVLGTPQARTDADILREIALGERRGHEFRLESRDLTVGTAAAGGNTVPTSFYASLVEHMREMSAVLMAGPTILDTDGGEAIQVPRTTGHGAAALVAEGGAIAESDPVFAQSTLNAYKYGQLIQLSTELVQDTGVDLLGYVSRVCGENVGLALGAHLVTGSGSSQPQGVATAATVGVTGATGVTGAFTPDNLIDLFYSVIAPYRNRPACAFMMRDASLAVARKFKDTTNQYLWQPAFTAGAPETILGRPVYTDPNIAATAVSARSVLFGDFSTYFVRRVRGVRFERSDEFAFANDLVTFRVLLRADGRLMDTTGAVKCFVGGAS